MPIPLRVSSTETATTATAIIITVSKSDLLHFVAVVAVKITERDLGFLGLLSWFTHSIFYSYAGCQFSVTPLQFKIGASMADFGRLPTTTLFS